MKRQQFEFRFDGPEAEAGARALAGFLARELPDCPAHVVRRSSRPAAAECGDEAVPASGARDAALTIAILALLVVIPSGIKDGLELADRFKPLAVRLIKWAKDRLEAGQRNPFIVLPPDNKIVRLDQARPDKLAAALAVHATSQPPAKP